MHNKKICVLGLGYIGLPTATLLSNVGYDVLGVDINNDIVDMVNQGKTHFVEPNLDKSLKVAVNSRSLKASNKPLEADIFIVCVPTPLHKSNNTFMPDTSNVIAAVRSIVKLLKPNNLLLIESTCPVGTTEQISKLLIDEGVDLSDIYLAYCPERVLPGNILYELKENNRIVGGITTEASSAAAHFYKTFVTGNISVTTSKTAEMCKLTENSFRDLNIAFANELSLICDKEDIDIQNLIGLANRHPRVNILDPGVGVGGHCIAVDPWFIVSRNKENTRLIQTARQVNTNKTLWVIDRIIKKADHFENQNGSKAKIACLGLSFKPNVDDLRESPAESIALNLSDRGFDVLCVEPNINSHSSLKLYSINEALSKADIIAILVKHNEFINLLHRDIPQTTNFLDFCGALAPELN